MLVKIGAWRKAFLEMEIKLKMVQIGHDNLDFRPLKIMSHRSTLPQRRDVNPDEVHLPLPQSLGGAIAWIKPPEYPYMWETGAHLRTTVIKNGKKLTKHATSYYLDASCRTLP